MCLSLQSEYGDIYRVSLTYSGSSVQELVIKYFDTIPPCISICVLKTGFLFAASEFGNHALFQFQVGGSEDTIESMQNVGGVTRGRTLSMDGHRPHLSARIHAGCH